MLHPFVIPGWTGFGVVTGSGRGSKLYQLRSGVHAAGAREMGVGVGAVELYVQYVDISDWQAGGIDSGSNPSAQSSSVIQQYWVASAMTLESVALKEMVSAGGV